MGPGLCLFDRIAIWRYPMKLRQMFFIFLPLLMVAVVAGLCFGSAPLSLSELVAAMTGGGAASHSIILWQVRLPRVADFQTEQSPSVSTHHLFRLSKRLPCTTIRVLKHNERCHRITVHSYNTWNNKQH